MRLWVVLAVMGGLATSARAATFVVTSTLDTDDKTADGKCADTNNKCTLRAAVTEANRDPAADVIEFNITGGSGVKTITIATPLVLSSPMTIDGTTQPGYVSGAPVIELARDIGATLAFDVTATCEIRGLRITAFSPQAILIHNGGAGTVRSNHFVGVPSTAIDVQGGAGSTVIGGALATDRNVFSSTSNAIMVRGGASDVKILGNYIGLDPTGTTAAGSSGSAIYVNDANVEIRGNVIAASPNGIELDAGAGTKIVADNLIGTDVTGTVPIGNGTGLRVRSGNVQITGNTISGNSNAGIILSGFQCTGAIVQGNKIGTTSSGLGPLPNQYGVQIEYGSTGSLIGGTTVEQRNVIAGNTAFGIHMTNYQAVFEPTRDHAIRGNYIGVGSDGTTAIPNPVGVYLLNSDHNIVESNRIAYNNGPGIAILGNSALDNTLRLNELFGNAGLGIDLGYDNITQNDFSLTAPVTLDGDIGPNGLQNYPVIAAGNEGSSTWLGGTLSSTAVEAFTVDFYSSPSCASGRTARQYLGSQSVMTSSTGQAKLLFQLARLPDGTGITATATSSSGSTSELSACVVASTCTNVSIVDALVDGAVETAYNQSIIPQFPAAFAVHHVDLLSGSLPPGLTLTDDGDVVGTPTTEGQFTFTVKVTDTRGCTGTKTLTMLVCPKIVIGPDNLPRVWPKTEFFMQLYASGPPPHEFFFDKPPPAGLELSPGGVISGPVRDEGLYTVYVGAREPGGCTGVRAYELIVACGLLELQADVPPGDLGAPYNLQLRVNGGQPPFHFELAPNAELPPGLSLSPDGVIAGKPRMRSDFTFTIIAVDRAGCRTQLSYVLSVIVSNEPGCDCATGNAPSAVLLVVVGGVVLRRRRRATA